jgi:hypothetical protein
MRKSEMEKLIKSSDLRADAQRLIAEGQMPDLGKLLGVVSSVRAKYVPRIMAARENAMGTRSTRSTSVRLQARADRIRAHGLSIRYSR